MRLMRSPTEFFRSLLERTLAPLTDLVVQVLEMLSRDRQRSESRLSAIEAGFAELGQTLQEIKSRLGAPSDGDLQVLQLLERDRQQAESRLSSIEAGLAELGQTLQQIKSPLGALADGDLQVLQLLERDRQQAESRLSSLETGTAELAAGLSAEALQAGARSADFMEKLADLQRRAAETVDRIHAIEKMIATEIVGADGGVTLAMRAIHGEIRERAVETTNSVVALRQALETKTFELANAVAGVGHLLETKVFENANRLVELHNMVKHVTSRVDTGAFETSNLLHDVINQTLHVGGLVENKAIHLENLIGERSRDMMVESLGRLLNVEADLRSRPKAKIGATAKPIENLTFETALARAKIDFPRQFDDWLERLEVLERAIAETPVGNLAHPADPYSRAFKSFVGRHATGTVLDVGCGTLGRPIYLADIPADRLHGLEPLALQAPFDFPVRRGIGEYLPWKDGSFDTVISATSVDHALSLDRALEEIGRVLVPSGRLLMWVGSNPGAAPFDPASSDYAPADRYHLFHIDRAWFEPLLQERFVMTDRVVMWTPSHENIFYSLIKRHD